MACGLGHGVVRELMLFVLVPLQKALLGVLYLRIGTVHDQVGLLLQLTVELEILSEVPQF